MALTPHPVISRLSRQQPYMTGNPYGFEQQEKSESDSAIVDFLHLLRRHRWALILSSTVGLILGFSIGIPMKPTWRVRSSVEILNLNEDFMNMKQANPTTTSNGDSFDTSEEQTQANILKSNALLDRVTAKLDPGAPIGRRRLDLATSGWRSWLHLSEPVKLSGRRAMIASAASSLKIQAIPRTRILEATVESKDPQFAVDFVNTLVQEYIQQNMEARFDSAHKTSEWLSREIDEVRTKLQSSEHALQSYAQESGLIFTDTDNSNNVATERLQQLQQALSAATADRISKQSRFELAKNSPPDSLADILQDKNLQDARSRLNDASRQVAELAAVFNPGYSKLESAQAQLASLQASFDRNRADVLRSIQNDFNEATRKEMLLSAAYDSQTREVTGQGQKSIQYNILKREVDSNRQLYDTMLQQTKQASIASAIRASNIRVVDRADLPDRAVSPDFKLNSLAGMASGLLLSMVFVTIRDGADRTLQQPGDLKGWVDIPELGIIPLASRRISSAYPRKTQIPGSSAVSISQGTSKAIHHKIELTTLNHKASMMAEAFRSALTSILFTGDDGHPPRVLVFTSANPGDGKSTIVSNLAIAAAEIRRTVLIIDADLRRPRQHDVFSLRNDVGLADLLATDYSPAQAQSFIQQTSIPGLDVLTSGSPTDAASHLLYSPHFESLLREAEGRYDLVLIDTPPMMQMTDARVVGRLADGVVLVARSGQTTRDLLSSAKERLEEDRIRILGAILNSWDPKLAHGNYGYKGSGYYKSGYAPVYSRNIDSE